MRATRSVGLGIALLTLGLVASCGDPPPGPGRPVIPAPVRFSEWSAPVNLGSDINSGLDDQGPDISSDGLSLFFASDRPGGLGGLDLYVSRRLGPNTPWGAPRRLGGGVNSGSAEDNPVFRSWVGGGWNLYFNSDRPGGCGADDLYMASGVAQFFGSEDAVASPPAWNLDPDCWGVNTSESESAPAFAYEADFSNMYFVRASGSGGRGRMYRTVFSDMEVSLPPEPIEELNSEFSSTHPM
ncbi:MAG: hypothetical protein L0Z49_14500, partial [Actinobacteria bacterium]|nr:hypothetical protein [Actinomycetota bacterium]